MDHSLAFFEIAEPEWREATRECTDHVENLQRAVEGRQLEVMLHELRDVESRMIVYHQEFK